MSEEQSKGSGSGSFLELDIDLRSDGFTAAERELMLAWYRDNPAWWQKIKSGEYAAYYEKHYGQRLADSKPAS